MDRYSLSTKDATLLTGIRYTDAHAVMPTKAILAVAALMTAALFIASIWTRSWRLPIVGVALLTITAIVVGGIYPALIQNLKVKPSEKSLEAPYLDRSIKATRAAYGLDEVDAQLYKAVTTASRDQLRNDADTIPGIRLVDPIVVSPTFRQLQAVKSYYSFPDALDVDRYRINGRLNDTVIAVRELDLEGVPSNQRNWLNDHTVYTHGFGVVAAYGNQRGEDGQPVFYQQNIPPVGPLPAFEPRIYFGEESPDYSIVGGAPGHPPREFDYPDSSAAGQKNNTYTGKGGVELRLLRAQGGLRHPVPGAEVPAVGRGQRPVTDALPPQAHSSGSRRSLPGSRSDGNPYRQSSAGGSSGSSTGTRPRRPTPTPGCRRSRTPPPTP